MKKTQPNTTTAPTGQIAPFGLRMLPELRARIEEEARNAGRSMNAEIVARLTESLDRPDSEIDVFTFAQEVSKGLPVAYKKAGVTIEMKVVYAEEQFNPTREEYDKTMAVLDKGKKKKKTDPLTMDADGVYAVTGIRAPD